MKTSTSAGIFFSCIILAGVFPPGFAQNTSSCWQKCTAANTGGESGETKGHHFCYWGCKACETCSTGGKWTAAAFSGTGQPGESLGRCEWQTYTAVGFLEKFNPPYERSTCLDPVVGCSRPECIQRCPANLPAMTRIECLGWCHLCATCGMPFTVTENATTLFFLCNGTDIDKLPDPTSTQCEIESLECNNPEAIAAKAPKAAFKGATRPFGSEPLDLILTSGLALTISVVGMFL